MGLKLVATLLIGALVAGCHEDGVVQRATDALDDSVSTAPDAAEVSVQPDVTTALPETRDGGDAVEDTTTEDTTTEVATTETSPDIDPTETEGDADPTETVDEVGVEDTTEDTTMPPDETDPPETTDDAGVEETAVLEDTAIQDAGVEEVIIVEPPRHPLVTELMAKNATGLVDGFGVMSDWIEVYNPHEVVIDLAGYRLSDELANLTKFVFPARELAPHAAVIVFASDEVAGPPGSGELHAPFKLAGDGETLYLASPSGEVIQTVAFPRELDDVSYGLPFEGAAVPLVAAGDRARYLLLAANEDPPVGWAEPGFDDSGWAEGASGFGWVATVAIPPGPEPTPGFLDDLGTPLADSVGDWSATGTQGFRGWTYGYWNRGQDGDKAYDDTELIEFSANFWTGNGFDWPNGNPPWTFVGKTAIHGNGPNNGDEQWPGRRWTSNVAGTVVVAWTLKKTNLNGEGVSGHLFVDGLELDEVAIGGTDGTGVSRVLTADVAVGSTIDLLHDPTGPTGNRNDGYDGSAMTLRIWHIAGESDFVQSAIPPAPPGGGILVRHGFLADVAPTDVLTVALRVDDGAETYLDGAPFAALNAPDTLDRTADAAQTVSLFSGPATVLAPDRTSHVMAIFARDAAVDDGQLFVQATLDAREIAIGDVPTWFTTPTPGAPNGPAATDLGPIMGGTSDGAAVGDEDPIVLVATIVPTIAPLQTTTLYYRVGFGAEVATELRDDGVAPDTVAGDDVFVAIIPASAAGPGEMVRWRFEAVDDAGRRTRDPEFLDPVDSHQYVGTVIADPRIDSNLPVLHWFMEDPGDADTESGGRAAVYFLGELYDNVRIDIHGQSTRAFPKKSHDVDFNATQRFRMVEGVQRMKDVNLLSNYGDKTKIRNTLAYGMLAAGGIDHHLAFPVRVQLNGGFYGVADLVEDGDDRWLERLGRDGNGALYKCYDSFESTSQAEKKTRKDEGKEDFQAVLDVLDQSSATIQNWIWDHVDIPGMVSFAANFVLISNRDCCWKNYYAYRDTVGTGEWTLLPWDVDLSFGHNWTPGPAYFDDTLYTQNPLWVGAGNRFVNAVYASTDFKAMVLRRIRTLMDELVQPADTPVELRRMEGRIAELQAQIGADADLDYDAWGTWGNGNTMDEEIARVVGEWFPARRAYLFDKLSATDKTIPPPQPYDVTLTIGAWDGGGTNPAEAYVRVHNDNAIAVDLSYARVIGDVTFSVRPGTVVAAGGDLYLVADVNAFRARAVSPKAGERRFIQGPWVGVLGAAPTVQIIDRAGAVVVSMP